MSDQSQRGRDDLLNDLVAIITASLATRSDDELAALIHALETGHLTGLEALPVINEAILVQVDPAASKDAVLTALEELQGWIDSHWESARSKLEGIHIPSVTRDPDPGMLN